MVGAIEPVTVLDTDGVLGVSGVVDIGVTEGLVVVVVVVSVGVGSAANIWRFYISNSADAKRKVYIHIYILDSTSSGASYAAARLR